MLTESEKIFSVLSFIFLVSQFKSFEGISSTLAIKQVTWEYFSPNTQLSESFFSSKEFSKTQCALKCSLVSQCLSFNFCSGNICQLNSEDVFSIGQNQTLLSATSNCANYGMKRSSFPVCNQKSIEQNIQDDDNPGFCRINEKRIDREWGPWVAEVVVETEREFKEIEKKQIVLDFAHGGKTGVDPTERIKKWLVFVTEKKNWNKAKVHCENLGGKLFSDLDGTVTQLEFIVGKFGYTPMWFGVHRESAASTQWITIDGELVPDNKILWGPTAGNPEQDMGEAIRVVMWSSNDVLYYLHDDGGNIGYSFLCDLKKY